MGVYLPGAGTLGCVVWAGAGIACCQGIPPDFYPPYVNVRPFVLWATLRLCASLPVSVTPPLLPIWMNVASLNPWLSDFHRARFSDGSGYYLF